MNQKTLNLKKYLFFGLIIFLFGCNNMSNKNVSGSDYEHSADSAKMADSAMVADSTKMADSSKLKANVTDKLDSNWTYHDEVNKMTDGKIFYAEVTSSNELSLSAPYDGFNDAHIQIRKKSGENNVILTIDKGQFITNVEGTAIRVRFDKNKAETFDCSESADYDPTVLFINSTSRFISKLKKSKKLIIEATLYQDGNQQMEFNVDGFKWNH